MKALSTFALGALLSTASFSQTCDLVFFTDDGLKFTLIVDGDVKNAAPATRVVATGIRNETPMCLVRFEDKTLPDVKQSGYFPLGKEYTVVVMTNKKGVRVFRPQGEAELGTAAHALSAEKPVPVDFRDDAPVEPVTGNTTNVQQDVEVGGAQTTTTTTVTEEGDADGGTEKVNMNIGVNGMNMNMNVGVSDGSTGGTTTTTHSTTTTTTTTGTTVARPQHAPRPVAQPVERPVPVEQAAYVMPGYSGKIGCPWPMNAGEFNDLKTSISSKSFEDSKMTLAKQVAGDRCMTVDQVKGIMGLFSFEDSKLEFAKFAYGHTYDISNYYKVNDAFTFESSIDELNEHIKSH